MYNDGILLLNELPQERNINPQGGYDFNKLHNVLIGKSFSTALTNDINNIHLLDAYDFVELPCGEPQELHKQINKCKKCSKAFALHYPSHYSIKTTGGNILDNTEKILNNITHYITNYSECLYIVIHFPFESFFGTSNIEKEKVFTSFNIFSNALEEYSKKILVENLSFHRYCNKGAHFKFLWSTSKTPIKMCFDIGHAFLVDGMNEIYSFFSKMKNEIVAIHLYNTTRNRQSNAYGKHLNFENLKGEIDFNDIWAYLKQLPNLNFIIDESENVIRTI